MLYSLGLCCLEDCPAYWRALHFQESESETKAMRMLENRFETSRSQLFVICHRKILLHPTLCTIFFLHVDVLFSY